MNKRYAGEPLNILSTYGSTLNIIFISFFYFTGMPVLVIFTFIHFFLTFIIEKKLIISHYSKSLYIDEKVN